MSASEDFYGNGAITSTAEDAEQVQIVSNGSNIIQVGKPIAEKESEATINVSIDGKAVTTPEVVPEDKPVEGEKVEEVKKGDETPKGENKDVPDATITEEVVKTMDTVKDLTTDLASKGVDFAALETEYATNGSLTAESMATLDKAGYPKSVVDAYLSGLQATADRFHERVIGMAGNAEGYEKITQEIKSQGDKYVKAFNQAIDSGNLVVIETMLTNAKALIQKRTGTANPSVLGNTSGAPQAVGVEPFATQKAMIDAINDPRYRSDVAYRNSVGARVEATPF
jgi:hypothetical protein